MATRQRRPNADTRERSRGGFAGQTSTLDQPSTASEMAFAYVSASDGASPTGPSAGSRLIIGGASGDMPVGTSVWADTGWFEEDGKKARVLVLTAPDGGGWSRFLENLLLDDDDGCAGVREPLLGPFIPGGLAGAVEPDRRLR